MKSIFCFTLKQLLVLTIFTFLSCLFDHNLENKQFQYTLCDILKCKTNQKMKFGQLIEFNMRSIFIQKSCTKYTGNTIARPFLKSRTWVYLWIKSLNFYTVYFYCISSWGLSKYIETKWQTTCSYLMHRFF